MMPVPSATLGEFRKSQNYAALTALPEGAVTVEVILGFWDRPLNGLARYQGEVYWFEAYFDEALDDYPHPRPYVLARVPQAVIDDELAWHRPFLEEVWDTSVQPWVVRFEAVRQRYYVESEARVPHDLDDAPLIGWTYLPDLTS